MTTASAHSLTLVGWTERSPEEQASERASEKEGDETPPQNDDKQCSSSVTVKKWPVARAGLVPPATLIPLTIIRCCYYYYDLFCYETITCDDDDDPNPRCPPFKPGPYLNWLNCAHGQASFSLCPSFPHTVSCKLVARN